MPKVGAYTCASCGKEFYPSAEEKLLGAIFNEGPYCRECEDLVGYGSKRCTACGSAIKLGEAVWIDKNPYHSACVAERYGTKD